VPGFVGYVPGRKTNAEPGQTFGKLTRQCLSVQAGLSNSKPFNLSTYKLGMQDEGDLIQLTSYKFGAPTCPKPSTKLDAPNWKTTQNAFYPKKARSFFDSKTKTAVYSDAD
jgi:hypothetical protein